MRKIAIVSAVILGIVVAAWSETPLDVVKSNIDYVLEALTNKKIPVEEKKRRIREAFEKTLDWEKIATLVLGIHNRRITPEKKKKFTLLFKEFIENVYANKFLRYSGEKIVYGKQFISGNRASVNMQLITTKGQRIPIVCRLIKRNGKWLIYDVMIEGISMVNNYRIQVNNVITKKGIDGLLKILERKVKRYKKA